MSESNENQEKQESKEKEFIIKLTDEGQMSVSGNEENVALGDMARISDIIIHNIIKTLQMENPKLAEEYKEEMISYIKNI